MSTNTGRRRGPYASTAQRRARIGDAALEIVLERGYQDVSAAEVARRAGLTTATVTYHFPTRDELLVAALEARERALSGSSLDGRLAHDADIDVAKSIGEFAETRESNPHYLVLFGRMAAAAADPDHPARSWLRAHHERARAGMAELLVALQQRGQAHADVEPAQFARQMVAVWDGLQTQWLADPTFDLAAEVSVAFRSLSRADTAEAKRAIHALAADL